MQEKKRRPGGRSAAVRDAVFAAARALFVPGEGLPTLAKIALDANVQKSTVYRRWPTVEALLHEAHADQPQRAIPIPDTGSLREDLRALARSSHRYLSSPEGRGLRAVLLNLPDAEKQAYWAQRYPKLRVIYARAIERGEITGDTDVDLYLDVFNASSYFALWGKGELLPLSRKYQLIELLLRSLAGGHKCSG
ncbi:MAG: TetR/AcrR family transcriptional regulator [Gemmatimonadaceae bacterium]